HQVAMGMATDPLDALAAQAEDPSRLGFAGNLDAGGAIQRRDLDFAAEGCRGEGNRHLAMQIVVITGEDGMRLEVNLDVKVARRAAIDAMFAFAGQPDAIALVDPGRNLHRQCLVLLDAPGTATALAGIGNEATGAVTLVAGLLDREEALLQ